MEDTNDLQILQERIKGLQENLRLLQRDVEKLEEDPFSAFPIWRRLSLFIFFALFIVMSSKFVGEQIFDRNAPKQITSTGMYFVDRDDTKHFGSISTFGPKFTLWDEGDNGSFQLSSRELAIDSKESGSARLSPRELRIESKDGTITLAQYSMGEVRGVIITSQSESEPTQRASLVLALPDGKDHLKPRLLILDNMNRPIE